MANTARKTFRPSYQWQAGFWKKHWIPSAVLVLVSTLIYFQARNYDFVLDDILVLTENQYVNEGIKGIPKIFANDAFSGYFGQQENLLPGSRYRPLSIALFAVEYSLWGLNPMGYHLINLLLYAALGILMYRVSLTFLPRFKNPHILLSLAFLSTLLYIVHPIHTECVANIKGRDEILAMLLSLTTLHALGGYLRHHRWPWLVGMAIAWMLGLLAKENTLTFLGVVPLAMYFFTSARPKTYALVLSILGVTTALYLGLRHQVIGYLVSNIPETTNIMNHPFSGMTDPQRYATIIYTLGDYLRLLFFPFRLTHDYYPYHVPISEWTDPKVILSALSYAALICAGVALAWSRRRVLGFGVLYYLVTLSIVSNLIISVGTFMNERFLFMPSWGYAIAMSYILVFWLSPKNKKLKHQLRSVGRMVLLLYIGFLGIRSYLRVPVWQSALTLNQAAVQVSHNSARANLFMGTALYNKALEETDSDQKRALLDSVEMYIDKSLSVWPEYQTAIKMKTGIATERYKDHRNIERLLSDFTVVVQMGPGNAYIHEYLQFLNGRGFYDDDLKDFYADVIVRRLLPDPDPEKRKWAYKYLSYAQEVAPQDPQVLYAWSRWYNATQDKKKAQSYLRRARALDPQIDRKMQ